MNELKVDGHTKRLSLGVAVAGVVALACASIASPASAKGALVQDWPPFVLVAGLLLIGLVAADDGLFESAGQRLARATRSGTVLFFGAAVLIGAVTAVLNLDTAVAFLTPVLVHTARSRGDREAPLLYGCLLLSNAGSLFLPGSNLTNLIVLGHTHVSGGTFLMHSWAAALAALVATTIIVAALEHRSLRAVPNDVTRPARPVTGLGLAAVLTSAILVVAVRSPALPIAVVGVFATSVRLWTRKVQANQVRDVLGAPMLIGLFGVAVALGTLGRSWSGPATFIGHLDLVGTAVVAALGSVLFNNLPAASLFAARAPTHPFTLLIGLNLGPNLFVTGSLAWLLWLRAARSAGARPSIATASRLGALVVPASMAAALGALVFSGSR